MAETKERSTLKDVLPRLQQSPAFWWGALFAWVALECLLSSIPGTEMPQVGIPNFDKFEHTGYFTAGGFLLAAALMVTFPGWPWVSRFAITVAAISLFGWADEWHQTFTPGRSGNDLYDWLSDTLGGIVGAGAARWVFQYVRTTRRFRNGRADRTAADRASPP